MDKITQVDQKGLAIARLEGATGKPPTPAGRKNIAFLQSPGIAHPTKSKVELGCMGKNGFFDDLKIWNAERVK